MRTKKMYLAFTALHADQVVALECAPEKEKYTRLQTELHVQGKKRLSGLMKEEEEYL